MSPEERAIHKAANRARYQRRFARHAPPLPSHGYPARLVMTARARACALLRGVPEYLQQVVRMQFGQKGTWGHGRYTSATKKGPGRRRLPPEQQNHHSGTKLVRRFIRGSGRESTFWRNAYATLTGNQYGGEAS